MGLLVQYSLVKNKLEGVDQHLKMTSKIRISRCSRRLLIILMSLTVTLFSEKKNTTCTRGILNCLYPTPFKAKINHCFCVSKFRRSSATQNKPCYQTLGRIAFLQGWPAHGAFIFYENNFLSKKLKKKKRLVHVVQYIILEWYYCILEWKFIIVYFWIGKLRKKLFWTNKKFVYLLS